MEKELIFKCTVDAYVSISVANTAFDPWLNSGSFATSAATDVIWYEESEESFNE